MCASLPFILLLCFTLLRLLLSNPIQSKKNPPCPSLDTRIAFFSRIRSVFSFICLRLYPLMSSGPQSRRPVLLATASFQNNQYVEDELGASRWQC
ncbi:hypothetical protein PAXRUDRAFT_832967 [Paxillus rubicundulus Ve08.2h10]|uniref:Secreted protein n=1 Tax=Paxillus rubicundulus Ve08.2h10 TaxID=930991 RepID=A0A0D0DQ27_9AGAM|nr:hypothetical protein PAXRUDRAFT_832967 [Paxillus rubicundulus Ve08.2h10]